MVKFQSVIATLKYESNGCSPSFSLNTIHFDAMPSFFETSEKKPESSISDVCITQYKQHEWFSTGRTEAEIDMFIVTTRDMTNLECMLEVRLQTLKNISLLPKQNEQDPIKKGYILEFDSGISLNTHEPFDFDAVIDGGCNKPSTTRVLGLKKVKI